MGCYKKRMTNLIPLIFSALLLALLAYLFRDSYLATIPLVGVALLVVLWPLYEKFRSLVRVAAEFSPSKARQQVRTAIDEYTLVAQQHAATAIELLLERLIFEYLLGTKN
jgi:hypothetical protein